ncbi:PREDICTED: phenylalanine--tRNA ligase alpha subunit-like [Amphimedon queenslandica]|uniref:Phenylalanyl-tRNA synthetase domain-containing protein n=1 Tax=Amphimedon queenslandica TaxID=400682 RepID=A0AAN0JAF9_AMPQE|nr:PREDICTED: phenylalanine--tRNA ligase alpha subunit-like [Amphimedon queenslandica]|eukprot:XP_019854045.1 PREDICTED: phenylalanine--tRNA ligase alpha subunit-like [Amphimedon queenslandica]
MLYKLGQQKEFTPVKYFSIDRVFRSETLDATHLAEFHQIEGVVADYNLTLGDLMGVLYAFFSKMASPIIQSYFRPEIKSVLVSRCPLLFTCVCCSCVHAVC